MMFEMIDSLPLDRAVSVSYYAVRLIAHATAAPEMTPPADLTAATNRTLDEADRDLALACLGEVEAAEGVSVYKLPESVGARYIRMLVDRVQRRVHAELKLDEGTGRRVLAELRRQPIVRAR